MFKRFRSYRVINEKVRFERSSFVDEQRSECLKRRQKTGKSGSIIICQLLPCLVLTLNKISIRVASPSMLISFLAFPFTKRSCSFSELTELAHSGRESK